MIRQTSRAWLQLAAMVAALTLLGSVSLVRAGSVQADDKKTPGQFTEQLVEVRTDDGFTLSGAIFAPPKESARRTIVIWVHGSGMNFYYPTYVRICRALAGRGYACISVNTRMHDLGTIAGWQGEKRIRGGGYWALNSEQDRDLAAWIKFAKDRGYAAIILAGHSAGSTAVRAYLAGKQDRRVIGMVYASGAIQPIKRTTDPDLLAQAKQQVAAGRGEDLLRFPNRSVPSFVSAATFLDLAQNAPDKDFFGVEKSNPGVAHIQCPILAFYGTKEPDVGTPADLELLKTCVKRLPTGPPHVDTAVIENAGHMYDGQEAQVAQVIAKWADTLVVPGAAKTDSPDQR